MRNDAKAFSQMVIDAFIAGNDDLIVELHRELNESQELYLEVWGAIPSTMRRQIKELVNRDL